MGKGVQIEKPLAGQPGSPIVIKKSGKALGAFYISLLTLTYVISATVFTLAIINR